MTETRYRFGPLERRGLIAGLRGGQIASLAVGLAAALLALRSGPGVWPVVVAVTTVLSGIGLAVWPIAGRTGEEWLPTVTRWAGAAAGRRRSRSPEPAAGRVSGVAGALGAPTRRRAPVRTVPPALAGISILQVARPGGLAVGDGGRAARATVAGSPVGVLCDRRTGSLTAAVAVRGHSFALAGADDRERKIAGWSSLLAGMAREGSRVRRLQWTASVLPDDGRALVAHLGERAALAESHPARSSYADLLAGAGAGAHRHEVLVALQTWPTHRRFGIRAPGRDGAGVVGASRVGGPAVRCARLLSEVDALCRQLGDAEVHVEGVLGPAEVASVFRRTGEAVPSAPASPEAVASASALPEDVASPTGPRGGPGRSAGPERNEVVGDARGDHDRWPWPMAVEQRWDCLRTDATWHATFWIAEWPRTDVGADFLAPLLLGPVRRTVSVVMEPLSPLEATRQVERDRTADVADAELRRRGGFLSTARRAREEELVVRREAELADGHASFRYSGYVTVTATSPEQLADDCEATEQAAGQARLELRRLYGDQLRAFTCTLPLCRGLS